MANRLLALFSLCLLSLSPAPAPAQAPPTRFASPRETLKTLYFSVQAYDYKPALIDEAVACLDSSPDQGRDFAESARLAVELDAVLRELCLPVCAVPEKPAGDSVVLFDSDGYHIVLAKQADGRWCFDRPTVERIPQMYRLALVRRRDLQPMRANLREEYSDPATTMRRFMSDAMTGDFYAAAQALDLGRLSIDQRADQGPILAQQLMFIIQRRGWIFFQEVPNMPDGPTYTWHADHDGRIAVDRSRQADGKDAWLFSKNTVRNLGPMYTAALKCEVDPRFVLLGRVVPPIRPSASGAQPPASVPPHLASPRALLKGFFRVMDQAESDDSRLGQAVECFDLQAVPAADRSALAAKLAPKLDAVLRKLAIDLAVIPDSWNAPTQVLGRDRGLHVELVRRREGTWAFSHTTIDQIPQLFDKLAALQRADRERSGHMETARDTMVTFLGAWNRHDDERAAQCLDLGDMHPRTRRAVGPILAFKLKYLIDRIGRVYPEEVPDEPEGIRYVFHSDDKGGRIVIARKTDGTDKGKWLFTAETVDLIEPMFLTMLGRPMDESLRGTVAADRNPCLEETPGIWLRMHVPQHLRQDLGGLETYQWIGIGLLVLLSWTTGRLGLVLVVAALMQVLKWFSSALTARFVAAKLRPVTWVAACWLFYHLLAWLDLPASWLDSILAARIMVVSLPLGWLGFQAVDLVLAIYTNSELLRPHRSLSDMIVPVCLRMLKGGIVLVVMTHIIYQVGHGEYLMHFLTGLGAAGLAASLAAQDILKSFFGTLLLVGERSFKLGDRLKVDGHEGVVEQVGFRSMRLRTTDGSLVTIPNSTIASASIDIQGAEAPRRHSATVALGKGLPVEQIASLRDRLHIWLRGHPAVRAETSEVTIGLDRDSGAELQVTLLLQDAQSGDVAKVRREINFAVLKMVQDMEQRGGGLRKVS